MSSSNLYTDRHHPIGIDKSVENVTDSPYLAVHTPKGTVYLDLQDKNYWTIGRGKDNTLIVPDNCISRNHAILQRTELGEFYLIDLGSRNGTFINGRRVSVPITLGNGDTITFGKTEIKFHSSRSATSKKSFQLTERDIQTSSMLERRLMSVVVIDIRNFTILARQIEEQKLSLMIGHWFREAGLLIRESGSWVDKYIGDAVMAIWFHGAIKIPHSDILNIFQAVYQICSLTETLTQEYALPFELKVGVGINTGYAMVGNTGSGDNPDFTAIGDTVNTAFRLESATKEVGIDLAIGEKTYEYLQALPLIQQLFGQYKVNLKGYEKPILAYGTTFKELYEFLITQTKLAQD
jgi:adenylate cyclase